jgi:hypothetical protein
MTDTLLHIEYAIVQEQSKGTSMQADEPYSRNHSFGLGGWRESDDIHSPKYRDGYF